MSDLARDVLMLAELVNEIDSDVTNLDEIALSEEEADQGLTCWATLEEANRILGIARTALAKKLAGRMTDKRRTIMGVGTFEKHRKADRKSWDKDALLRSVLDSMVVDAGTGEVLDPNPDDKILRVWNLGAPRVTALRERGLDPDEFCSVEYGGLTLQLVADNRPATSEEAA